MREMDKNPKDYKLRNWAPNGQSRDWTPADDAMQPGYLMQEKCLVNGRETVIDRPVFGPKYKTNEDNIRLSHKQRDQMVAARADKEAADDAAWAAAEAAAEAEWRRAQMAARRRVKLRKGALALSALSPLACMHDMTAFRDLPVGLQEYIQLIAYWQSLLSAATSSALRPPRSCTNWPLWCDCDQHEQGTYAALSLTTLPLAAARDCLYLAQF